MSDDPPGPVPGVLEETGDSPPAPSGRFGLLGLLGAELTRAGVPVGAVAPAERNAGCAVAVLQHMRTSAPGPSAPIRVTVYN